jgi:hypothetical protein
LKANGFGMDSIIHGIMVTGLHQGMGIDGNRVHGKKEIADGTGIAGIGKDKLCFYK